MKHKLMILFLLVILTLGSVWQFAAAAGTGQLAIPRLVVNTSFLNVRTGDGPQYSVIMVVPGGTELPVLGTNGDNSWYLVTSSAGAGWVDVSFTLPRGDFRNVPELSPTVGVEPMAQTPLSIGLYSAQAAAAASQSVGAPIPALQVPHVIVNTHALNIRTGPNAAFEVLFTVYGGASLDVIGVTSDNAWFEVSGSFGQGWVASDFVIFRGTFSNVPVIENAY